MKLVPFALLVSIAFPCAAFAQDPPPAPKPDAPKPEAAKPDASKEVTRLEAWPKLDAAAADRTKVDVEKLRKARTEEMTNQAQASLVQTGAGATPNLLTALAHEEDAAARGRILAVLEKLVTAEDTRLLAKEFDNKSPLVRIFALRRAAAFPDSALKASAAASLAKARKGTDKDELYYAALCVTSTGSLDGFDVLQQVAGEAWGKHGTEIHDALGAVRGKEATQKIRSAIKPEDSPKPGDPALKPADRMRVVSALNLLAACGEKESAGIVMPFLDSNDNSVRIAAINAARGIVEGLPPVAELPVFDAIEMARKLKAKLSGQ